MAHCQAEEWPGLLGKNRDGQANSIVVAADSWSAGPNIKWSYDLGSGYAGAAVHSSAEGNLVLIPHREGNNEMLTAIDFATGQKRWQTPWNASYSASINPDNGPRCVPSVKGDRVVCYGAAGDLICCKLSDGSILWQRALRKDYAARDGYFGAGSSPLIVGNRVIACPGGRDAGIVALDLATGKTIWTATDYEASYSSPIAFQSGSETLLLCVMRLSAVLLNANDGKLLSEIRFGARGPTVNAATPVSLSNQPQDFFLTASYGVGCVLVKAKGIELKEQYRSKSLISSQYNTPVAIDDKIFGIDGREDVGGASLKCIDPIQQKVIWSRANYGTAHLIAAKNAVLALTLTGKLEAIDTQSDSFSSLANWQLPRGEYRAVPAAAANTVLIRASLSPSRSKLFAVQLP